MVTVPGAMGIYCMYDDGAFTKKFTLGQSWPRKTLFGNCVRCFPCDYLEGMLCLTIGT